MVDSFIFVLAFVCVWTWCLSVFWLPGTLMVFVFCGDGPVVGVICLSVFVCQNVALTGPLE